MTDLGPGTPLICVDATIVDPSNTKEFRLTEGAMYFVDQIVSAGRGSCSRDGCGDAYVVPRGQKIGYCPNRFRPLNDGSTDLVDDAEPVAPRVAEPA